MYRPRKADRSTSKGQKPIAGETIEAKMRRVLNNKEPIKDGAPKGGDEATRMAGMGIQSAMQLAMMKAQKENIEADTEQKKADAAATAGVRTDVGKQQIDESKARTEALLQGVDNARQDYEIKRLQIARDNMTNFEQGATQEDRIAQIKWSAGRAKEELVNILNSNYITSKTIPDRIRIIQEEAIGAILKNALTKEYIKNQPVERAVDQQKINESIQTIMQNWDKMSQYNQELMLKDIMTSYNTDPVNQILPEIADAIGDILKGAGKR